MFVGGGFELCQGSCCMATGAVAARLQCGGYCPGSRGLRRSVVRVWLSGMLLDSAPLGLFWPGRLPGRPHQGLAAAQRPVPAQV